MGVYSVYLIHHTRDTKNRNSYSHFQQLRETHQDIKEHKTIFLWFHCLNVSQSVQSVQSLSRVRLFAIPWTAACQASLSITNSWSFLKLMSIELVMLSNHLIYTIPFSSHLQSFPASGAFQMSKFFTSDGQNIRVSASTSVLPMNIQTDFF